MLTAENDPAHKENSKNLGVKGWFTKPFSPDILLKKLRDLLKS
jgi:DNA-binding response OmpR family regulator